jgi:hypothetical protein
MDVAVRLSAKPTKNAIKQGNKGSKSFGINVETNLYVLSAQCSDSVRTWYMALEVKCTTFFCNMEESRLSNHSEEISSMA